MPGRQDFDSILTDLDTIKRRLRALESSPQAPYSSISAGALKVRNASGVERLRYGKVDDNDNYGLVLLDTDGSELIRLGEQTDGTDALRVNDASGSEKVRLGERSGVHSLFVTSGGVTTDVIKYVFGPQYASVVTTQSTTSTGVTDLATIGPSVTVEVGASGKLLVLGGAYIGVDSVAGSFERGVALYRFSTAPSTYYTAGLVGGAADVEASSAGGQVHTGFTPGASITVDMRYQSTFGGTAQFANRWLYVQPL